MHGVCESCGHMWFYHRDSSEWRLLHPKETGSGCTKDGCACKKAV